MALPVKKRPTVFYMNHKFNQHSKNNKGCIHWRCVEYARFKCRAKLVTFENKMLENSTPVHTHPTVKSSIAQKCTKSAREQQAYAFDSFRTEDIEKQDEPKNSTLSSPVHSDDTNTEEKKNELQALYNTLDPEEICENTDETSDEEFWKRWNSSTLDKGYNKNQNESQTLRNTLDPEEICENTDETSDEEFWKRCNSTTLKTGDKSQFMPRFRKNRVAKPESVASKLTNSNAKSAASKTLLRTKNDLRGLRKNSKLNNKCSRKVKWLDY